MLVFRYFVSVSGGVLLTVIGTMGAIAQTLAPSDTQFSNSPPLVREIEQMETTQEPTSNKQFGSPTDNPVNPVDPIQPVTPAPPITPFEPAPPDLNPSGNPLLFPTQPEEVEVTKAQPITLNQAIELALYNNRQLQRTRLELQAQQAQLRVEKAALYPTLDTNVTFDRQLSPQTRFAVDAAQENIDQALELGLTPDSPNFPQLPDQTGADTSVNGQLRLIYSIYAGGERAARIERAVQQVRQQQLEVERIAEQTRFETTERYYLLQNADAQVAIAQAAVEDTTQSLRDAQLLEQAGLGTRFDTLRAEVDLARANQGLTTAISDQRVARRRLVEFLSLGQHIVVTAADEISEAGEWPLSLEQSIVQAYKNRAELEQQLAQRQISEQEREIALSAVKPDVQFIASYDFLDDFDDRFGAADGYRFGAIVTWTFFDGGAAFAGARVANRNIDIANTEFANQRNQIRLEVEQAYFNLISNRENIGTTRLNVARAEEALRLARLRFQAGVGTQTDVINSQRDLTDARSEFLQAIINYNRSLNALQRAVSNFPDNRLFDFR